MPKQIKKKKDKDKEKKKSKNKQINVYVNSFNKKKITKSSSSTTAAKAAAAAAVAPPSTPHVIMGGHSPPTSASHFTPPVSYKGIESVLEQVIASKFKLPNDERPTPKLHYNMEIFNTPQTVTPMIKQEVVSPPKIKREFLTPIQNFVPQPNMFGDILPLQEDAPSELSDAVNSPFEDFATRAREEEDRRLREYDTKQLAKNIRQNAVHVNDGNQTDTVFSTIKPSNGRGRKKGSKNKPKPVSEGTNTTPSIESAQFYESST